MPIQTSELHRTEAFGEVVDGEAVAHDDILADRGANRSRSTGHVLPAVSSLHNNEIGTGDWCPVRRLRGAEDVYKRLELSEELEHLPVEVGLDVLIDVLAVLTNDVVALSAQSAKPEKRA